MTIKILRKAFPLVSLVSLALVTVLCAAVVQMPGAQRRLEQSTPGGPDALDFWVGYWNLTWKDKDGSMATGTNKINKILKNKVIKEEFRARSGSMKGYKGRSLSVYNPATGAWRQTWVDSESAYLNFTGEFEGDKRMFKRVFTSKDGKKIMQRMVFYNITVDKLDWDWEISVDQGKTWKLQWRIHYTRDKSKKKKKKKKKKNNTQPS
jgi:hypothetical protein